MITGYTILTRNKYNYSVELTILLSKSNTPNTGAQWLYII